MQYQAIEVGKSEKSATNKYPEFLLALTIMKSSRQYLRVKVIDCGLVPQVIPLRLEGLGNIAGNIFIENNLNPEELPDLRNPTQLIVLPL